MTIQNQYQKIVPFIIFVAAAYLFFRLVQPMIAILLSSVLLAYISHPLRKRLLKIMPNKTITIILSLIIVFSVILIPFSFLAFEITQQGYYFFNSISGNIAKGALFGFGCASESSKVCSLINQAELFSLDRLTTFGVDQQIAKFLPVLEAEIAGFIINLPIIFAEIFLALVLAYFIMKEWRIILSKIIGLLPMRAKTVKRLTHEFGNITYTVIYAQIFVALVQGIIGTAGYLIFGVPFPVFLGVVTAFFALIPTVGTALIWAPVSLYLALSGYFSHNYWLLGKGIGLFLYGLLIVSFIDNLLLAKIVHAKAKVSQIIVIIGVIGGASMFGIVGIFIGPILLPLLITYFETFKERF